MAWNDPSGDLRRFLRDTVDDNLIKSQAVAGDRNGTNTQFLTFFDRLYASGVQSSVADPRQRLRAFLNGTELVASGVTVTDATRGEFTISAAPTTSQELKVTYHFQMFRDDELAFFLQQAAGEVSVDLPSNIPPGLQMAAMNIAASLAYGGLAERWMQRKMDQFGFQEIDADSIAERVKFYAERCDRYLEKGAALRREYYDLGKDRGRRPAFGILSRPPRPYGPQR